MRTTLMCLFSCLLFSSFTYANDLVDMPVPELEIAELESAASSSTDDVVEENRTPASAKDRRDMVIQTISKNFSTLKSCYQKGLKQNAEMKGKVIMTWDIDSRGKVRAAGIEDSQLNSKPVEECMVQKFSEWHFPSRAKIAGSKDRMSYTFHFVP